MPFSKKYHVNMIGLEFLPISTLLTGLTGEILETAFAAHDVYMEKETFKSLSYYLCSITPVLEELMKKDIKNPLAIQQALKLLQRVIGEAKNLVNLCKRKSRFYQLIHCRNIVRSVQEVTRDIGKSLALLPLAKTDVFMDIRNIIEKLKDQMTDVEYQVSQQKLEVVRRIEIGIKEHKTDQVFLNELIREIATVVGIQGKDSSEMRMVLDDFRREKEEAADNKEREEEAYMDQIIALLSRADVVRTPQAMREEYRLLKDTVHSNEELPPFDAYFCPLSNAVMDDPVSVVTGQTYERLRIQEWFASGNNTDPCTNQILPSLDLKPNHKLRECIEEWFDRNYCIRIATVRKKLESGEAVVKNEALHELQELLQCSFKIRHWIAEEQLVALMVDLLSGNKSIRCNILSAMQKIVSDSDDNKRQFVDAGGIEIAVECLARNLRVSKLAVALLVELLQFGSAGMPDVTGVVLEKLSQVGDSIHLLVTVLNNREDLEASCNAEIILTQLCGKDENVVAMAKANWFTPLLERLGHDSSVETLGERGVIQILVEMLSGSVEVKGASLRALRRLLSCRANKRRLADAGAVPLILDHIMMVQMPVNVRESAATILEMLVLSDGTKFLVDANGNALDSGQIFDDLLALQGSASNVSSVCKHALHCLQGLVSLPLSSSSRRAFKDAHGISILLPLIEYREAEVRNAAVQILCFLASEHAHEISNYIKLRRLAGVLVSLLNNEWQRDVAAAAAGILASLPQYDTTLTKELVEGNAIPALMHLVAQGNATLKENAIGALLRFTLPSDIELQRKLVDLGIYTALKGLIYSGTHLSKLRAAHAFRNFSTSTMKLSSPSKPPRYFSGKKKSAVCRVHGGLCKEKTTFCLVEAEVVPDLVLLVRNKETDLAAASVDALLTLLPENENLENCAKLFHDENAIGPILDLLSDGTEQSKERALFLLRKIFNVKSVANQYADKARIILVQLTIQGTGLIGKQAARVLASLENCGASSVR